MGGKKKVEPKSAAKKSEKAAAKDDRKVERRNPRFSSSNAHMKHNVTRLG